MIRARSGTFAIVFSLVVAAAAAAQSIPGMPQGTQTGDSGGAYTGLASSPEANLFTGVAQTSIPIEVPPGRLGLAPVLALTYSSSSGPGVYGYGWSLSLPRIHRSTRGGVPRYDDSDAFVLELPGATIELERKPNSQRAFRPVVEGSFPRIGFQEGENTWKVVDKLGVTFLFGASAAFRVGRGAARDKTFAWLLESVEDPAGNRIDFEYQRGGPAGTSNGRPQRILYGANPRAGAAHFAEVHFEWASLQHAGPATVSWREGHEDLLDARLSAIETASHGLRARRYDFSHEEDEVTADLRLVAATLTAYADNPADDITLPSTVFLYARSMSAGWASIPSPSALQASFEVPDAGLLRTERKQIRLDSSDLNGDSIVDRIDTLQRPPVVMLGSGQGFDAPRDWNWPSAASAPTTVRSTDGRGDLVSNVFDIDGDGFADLVASASSACGGAAHTWCVWRGSDDGFADRPVQWWSPAEVLRLTAYDGARITTDLVDMDADGRLDLLDATPFDEASGALYWHLYRNTGDGFARTPVSFQAPVAWLARSEGPRQLYGLFDINSDALPDLVSADVDDGGGNPRWTGFPEWHVYFHRGDGFAVEAASWPVDGGATFTTGLPNFLSMHASDGSVIADLFDITGDGRPDLVRRWRPDEAIVAGGTDRCQPRSCEPPAGETTSAVSDGFCCYNLFVYANTGSSFARPVTWASPAHGLRADHDLCPDDWIECSGSLLYDFDFFDFDGDGLVDFVERYTANYRPSSWLVRPHPASTRAGGTRPNLMRAMRNGVGGETVLRYAAAASSEGTRLPFPHWTVRERELRDSIYDGTALRTSFVYAGGWFDPVDREMRGFAMVQEVDPVGTTRVREYHQDRRRAGRVQRSTTLAPPPCAAATPGEPDDPCSPWQHALGQSDYDWPAQGPLLLRAETDVPVHRGQPVENLRRRTSYTYDAYGNTASRRTETPMAPATTTTTSYVHRVSDKPGGMPDRYSVAKPSGARTTQDGVPHPLVERSFEYSWQAPAPGVLTAAATCMEWTAGDCSRWSRRVFDYDAFGNAVAAQGPDGGISRIEFDEQSLFAIRAVDAAGLVTRSTTDPRTGRVVETIEANGNALGSRHDGLGRLLRTWGPGTSEDAPLRRFDYAPGALGAGPPRVVMTDAATGVTARFFDGLGRPIATKTSSERSGQEVSVVAGLRRYDARGLVIAESLPFDSANLETASLVERFADAPAWLELHYDYAGRLTETVAPDGSSTLRDSSAPGILVTTDANVGSSSPGAVTIEIFDGLGHRILRDTCSAVPVEPAPYDCPAAALKRRESWIYDGLGRIEERRSSALDQAAADSVTRVTRDGLGNRSSVEHSNAGLWTFRHDDSGRQVEVRKPDGVRVSIAYDAAGRILRRRGPDGSASYRYHAAGGGIGKVRRFVTRSRAARVSEQMTYDERGRLVLRHRRIAARGYDSAELSAAYRYDDLDRRIETEFLDWQGDGGAFLQTAYDRFGRPSRLWSDVFEYVRSAKYDSDGRRLRVDYGNGTTDLLRYEERSNAARQAGYLRCARTTRTAGAVEDACALSAQDLLARHFLRYDRIGNLLSADDMLFDATDPRQDNLRYQYDALGRVSLAGSPANRRERFSFDGIGNLRQNGGFTLEYLDADHPGQLTGIRDAEGRLSLVEHDANGRRIRDGETSFAYDDADRLVSVSIGTELVRQYAYMDDGQRVLVHEPLLGVHQFELGDGVRIDGDQLERTVSFAGRAIVVERSALLPRSARGRALRATPATGDPPRRVFLHHDHQQSVKLVTDQAGAAIEYDRYRAYGLKSARLDGAGQATGRITTPRGFTDHLVDEETGLLFFGKRYYDARSGSFLTMDPALQFASPYAYSNGNPVAGRDGDGSLFELGAIEILAIAVGTASFVDAVVSTGDLGHSLTAGVFAGFSVYLGGQISTAIARPLVSTRHAWVQMAASVGIEGFQAWQAVEAIEDGRYAGGIVAAGMLAASLIGIETAADPGAGATSEQQYARHGIKDRGVIEGRRVIDVDGICATRPGCFSNAAIALRENIRVLFGGKAGCVGGCQYIRQITDEALEGPHDVLLRCNSFGSIKCLGAIQQSGLGESLARKAASGATLSVQMSGTPLLRPPVIEGVTYQVNLFDPVVWTGSAYSTATRSDVVLGANWWVPAPLIVHHTRMYEKGFFSALGDMVP